MKESVAAYLKRQSPQLDKEGQWAFLPNARTGSTSVTGVALADRVVMSHRGRKCWETTWRKFVQPRLDDVFWFTFVRNPWDRVVSAWCLLQKRGRITEPLPQFLKNGGLSNPRFDHFFQPQSTSFMMGGVRLDEVFVGYFERQETDWREIAGCIGADPTLPHRNATVHETYTTYYDAESVRIVGRFYASEITALGYEFAK